MNVYDVVIVGAGHGGASTAIQLRQRGFAGGIAVIGDEPELPYERPPLSKEYLAGNKPFERLLIRPPAFWAERDVAILLGREVVEVDPHAHRVTTAAGETIGYRTLIWAAGGRPRRLRCTGHDLAGVHAIRTRADVDRLAAELPTIRRVAVIGGGYVGLEAAAVLTGLGKQVTVLEAQDRLLPRVAGAALSAFYAAEHQAHGVALRFGAAVTGIEGRDGRANGVRFQDGELLPCDLVIVGIGIVPAVAPLLTAGAAGGNGVAVDAHCRTTLPDIYALGDGALHANTHAGGATIRLESVANANDMATVVARAITGRPEPYAATPWFWSNQYDLKLQTVGLSIGHDAEVVRGDPAARAFSVAYLRDGRVVAFDCVNMVRDYVQGRALLGRRIDAASLSDRARALKDLA